MAKVWDVNYKGHTITVENRLFSERLIVDGELQDEKIGYDFRSRLSGKIRCGEGQGEHIKVSVGGVFSVGCRVFIDERLVFSRG